MAVFSRLPVTSSKGEEGFFPSLLVTGLDNSDKCNVCYNQKKYNGIKKKSSNLPDGYNPLTYIESDGSGAYIDMEFKATEEYGMRIIEMPMDRAYTSGSGCYNPYWGVNFGKSGYGAHIYWQPQSGNSYVFLASSYSAGVWHDVSFNIDNDRKVYVDNAYVTQLTSGTFSHTQNALLFANSTGGTQIAYDDQRTKMALVEIYKSGEIYKTFVPCYRVSDDEVGMYEIIEGKFYENKGSGAFKKGEEGFPIVALVPPMSSNENGKFKVTSSSYLVESANTRYDYYAFDKISNDSYKAWLGRYQVNDEWLQIDLGEELYVEYVQFKMQSGSSSSSTLSAKIQISNDGKSFFDIKTVSETFSGGFSSEITCDIESNIRYLRFQGVSTTAYIGIAEMQLYGRQFSKKCSMLFEHLKDLGMYQIFVSDVSGNDYLYNILIDIPASFSFNIEKADVDDAKILYLYNEGDECTDITGGWSASGYVTGSTAYRMYSGTKNSDNMEISGQSSSALQLLGTSNAIDLSGYSKILIDADEISVYEDSFLCHVSSTKNLYDEGANVLALAKGTTTGRKIFEIDISSINTLAYIIFTQRYTAQRHFKVYNVWLKSSGKVYLYKADNECTDVTGGWGDGCYTTYASGKWCGSKTDKYFEIADGTSNYCRCGWSTQNKIDFSKYNKMYIRYQWVSVGSYSDKLSFSIGLDTTLKSGVYTSNNAEEYSQSIGGIGYSDLNEHVWCIDISDINNNDYFRFMMTSYYYTGQSGTIRIYDIWIE